MKIAPVLIDLSEANSRSLMNDDIIGAKPKYYGIGSSPITNAYAGVSSGLQARLRNNEAPFGLGGNLDSTSYGKKWIVKTEKGLKSKPKQYDSIDQERERISESSKPDNQGYRAMYEIPEPAVQERNEGEKSYIEQKKEEYRRYMPQQQEEVEEQNQYEQDYYDQEQRRLQMQYELEQEMERINRTNDLAKGNVQMNQDYEKEYDERNGKGYNKEQDIGYQPLEQIVVKKVRPKAMVAAGGKSIRQQSEENKFTLSGYTNSEMKGKSKVFSNYETSSNVYGNADHASLGIALNARNMKAYGRQSSNKEKGFNVITGEYFD